MILQYYKKRFTIEIAKANRKCRGKGCKAEIQRGVYCMVVNQLTEVPINKPFQGMNWRNVYKKESYCAKCSYFLLEKFIEDINTERDHFITLKEKMSDYARKKYRGLIVGED